MRKSATKMIDSHASRPTTIPEHLGVRPPGRTQRACPSPGQLEPASKTPPCLEGGRLGRRARRGRQAHATVRAPPWIVRPHNGALDPPGRGTDGRRLSDCTSTQSRGCCGVLIEERQAVSDAWGVLSAWRGRPAGTPFGFSVWALPVVMAATGGASCLSLVSLCIC